MIYEKKILSLLFFFISLNLIAQEHNAGSLLDKLIFKQDFRARRESSANENLNKNGDNISIAPGKTVLLGELLGPGIINHIWMTISSANPFYGRSLVLRIYWDGNKKPSVEVPIGDFFGVGHGAAISFESQPVSTSSLGRSKNCYWKMPFLKKAKITITNESKEYSAGIYYYLDWEEHLNLPKDILYFHANYKQQFPAQKGDYILLETEGEGQYVGTIYSVQNMELGWFGEGDDRFYIDGEEHPSLKGTGTEDYFGDAWGFRQFDRPFYGVPLWEGYYPGARTTAYRWHIQDPIPFNKSIKVTMEHYGSIYYETGTMLSGYIERKDWISSVAIWYQSVPIGLKKSIPQEKDRIAPYRIIKPDDLNVKTNKKRRLDKSDGILYFPMRPKAYIEFEFNIEKSGTYKLSAILRQTLFGSLYKAYLDGKEISKTFDLNTSGEDPVWKNFHLHNLLKGKHTLRFKGKGISPNMLPQTPKLYLFGLDYLILLRLEDMAGYHEVYNELTKSKK